jgi:hypothetical protein
MRMPLRGLARGALALDLVGAWLAARHHLIGEPLGIRPPRALPEALVVAGWGTALSGPLLADGVLIAVAPAADRAHPGARRAVALLAALRLAGVLSEPVTWGRRPPRRTMIVAAGHFAVGAALLRSATAPCPPVSS